MKNKVILVVMLLAISATTAWFSPTMSKSLAQASPTRAKTTTELELENQIRLAKVDLHKAATDYLLSIERMQNELITIEVQFKMGRSHECIMAKVAGNPCPPVRQMDYPRFVGDIKKSANHLKQAQFHFISRIKSLRHDACKKLGYACKWSEGSLEVLTDLPTTDLDNEINKASKIFPNTKKIVEDIVQQHRLNLQSINSRGAS